MGRASLLLVVIAVGVLSPRGAAASLQVHYPPENLVISGGGVLHVIAEPEGSVAADGLDVRLNGESAGSGVARPREDGGTVYHAAVQLSFGINAVEVLLRAGGQVVAKAERKVFFLSALGKQTHSPADFSRRPFHLAGREAACVGCHQLAPRPEDAGPPTPEQSTCHSCHAGLTKSKEVHGPTAFWACTRCHDPTSARARYATPEPVMTLCFSCHTELKERFYGRPYQHGPTATGQCTICHNPHGSQERFFLKKAAWNLCTTCHFEKAGPRHVIAWGPRGQGHPTRGRPDPTRPKHELSCASCHNPHAAFAPRLWKFGAERRLDLCRNCHRRIVGG